MLLKNNIIIKPRAYLDLKEIYRFSAREFGIIRAQQYIKDFNTATKKLSANPLLGYSYTYNREYRIYKLVSHLIFYRILQNDIEVVRILHKSMDCAKYL